MSKLEQQFLDAWKRHGNDNMPHREFRFHATRRFRFDFAWPAEKLAIELQGYGYGHQSIKGMTQDCNKHNLATYDGWRVLYFTSNHFQNDEMQHEAIDLVAHLLRSKE